MRIVPYSISLYKAVMAVDEDYIDHGELPYFGFRSFLDYTAWLLMLKEHRRGADLPKGWSPYELQALVDDRGRICALGQLRYGDTPDNTTWLGHIGYSVPPSLRGRGYAKCYLTLALQYAFAHGFERVLLTCDVDNAPSRAVIEHCGGQYAGQYHDENYHKRLYWFEKS